MAAFNEAWQLISKLSTDQSVDCYLYIGAINRRGYDNITNEFSGKKFSKAYLFLSTLGGDPAAGYRVVRAMRHHYEHLTIIVPTYCKSAGTLMAIGADELVIADKGELGPLDMQLKKPDELFDMSSGLDITQAMAFLRTQSADILKSTLVDLNVQFSVTTKMAAEIATKLTTGLVAPIYAQIDPYKIGESQRAVSIAFSYGKRLNDKIKNLKNDDSLRSLVLDYPSHGFVIDRKEASSLFKNVRAPSDLELAAVESLYDLCNYPDLNSPFVSLIPHTEINEGNDNVQDEPRAESDQADQQSGELKVATDDQPRAADERDFDGAGQGRQKIPDPASD